MVYGKWMMKRSSGNCTSFEALVQARELEAKFLTCISERGIFDTSVRSLCSNLRDLYENIILSDHDFAEAQNVEHFLWQLHYIQIEGFRHLITSDRDWSIAHDGRGNTVGLKKDWLNSLQSKPVVVGFRSFLAEASGFYHELLMKLRVGCGLALDLWDGMDYQKREVTKLKRCQQSCYRCLVNLGDYARYKEYYIGNDPSSYNFSIAAGFYRQAIAHWPVCGQPHNQLAVLAVHVKDELLAVYHYFRSLAVEKPFPTTRENLTILFDKNRVKYEELPPIHVKLVVSQSRSISRKGFEGVKSSWVSKATSRIPAKQTGSELNGCFFVRFVRLNGLFFTKTSLEKFEEVFAEVLHDLQLLLALDDKDLELALGSGSCFGMARVTHSAFGSIKLVVILICTLENVHCGPIEVPQTNVLFQKASIALLAIVGRLFERCAESQRASESPLLPSMLVFLEWLSCRRDIVWGVDRDDEHFKLLSFIWKQLIKLLNKLCNETKFKKANPDRKEVSTLDVALWEDFELQGFTPLSSAHVSLFYPEKPKESDSDITKDHLSRVQRFVAAGNALASMAEGSSMRFVFSQAMSKGQFPGTGENKICREDVIEVTETENNVDLRQNKHACRDDDDDDDEEELIVFQPAPKKIVMANSGCGTSAAEPSKHEPSLTNLCASSVSDVIVTACAPHPECLPNPLMLYNVSSAPCLGSYFADPVSSEAMNSHAKDLKNLSSLACQTEQFEQPALSKLNRQENLSFFEQPYRKNLNNFFGGSLHHVHGDELSSSVGLRKPLGVIGPPKQTPTNKVETGESDTKGLNWSHKDVCHFSSMSPFVTSLLKQQLSISEEKLRKEDQGRSDAGIASKVVGAATYCASGHSNQATSLTGPVLCPPPGFGPRPTLKPPGYTLCSDVNKKVLQTGGGTFSTSSAPLVSLRGSKQLQASSQLENENKTWSLFGSTDGFSWNSTITS